MEVHCFSTLRIPLPAGPCQNCGKPGHATMMMPRLALKEEAPLKLLCPKCADVEMDADAIKNIETLKQHIARAPEGSKAHAFWTGMLELSELSTRLLQQQKSTGLKISAKDTQLLHDANERLKEVFYAYTAEDRDASR